MGGEGEGAATAVAAAGDASVSSKAEDGTLIERAASGDVTRGGPPQTALPPPAEADKRRRRLDGVERTRQQ